MPPFKRLQEAQDPVYNEELVPAIGDTGEDFVPGPLPSESELPPPMTIPPPMLTNIPATAERSLREGQPTYFLSDRPETESYLRETGEEPFKRVLRDVPPPRPSPDQLSLSQSWKDFSDNEGSKILGFHPDKINPGEDARKARESYLNQLSPMQLGDMSPKDRNSFFSEADRRGKSAWQESVGKANMAKMIRSQFEKDWAEKQKRLKEIGEPSKEPVVPVMEGNKIVYRRRTEAVGKEAPPNLVPVEDAEGNITYQPRPTAIGKAPPAKPGKKAKEVSYVGWDKQGKETVERVDVDDTEAQSDLIGKGYVEKTKFDRMDIVDRKLAQREAMKRIGGKLSQYKTPEDVRKDYKSGKIKKEDALKILREDFGMAK